MSEYQACRIKELIWAFWPNLWINIIYFLKWRTRANSKIKILSPFILYFQVLAWIYLPYGGSLVDYEMPRNIVFTSCCCLCQFVTWSIWFWLLSVFLYHKSAKDTRMKFTYTWYHILSHWLKCHYALQLWRQWRLQSNDTFHSVIRFSDTDSTSRHGILWPQSSHFPSVTIYQDFLNSKQIQFWKRNPVTLVQMRVSYSLELGVGSTTYLLKLSNLFQKQTCT